MAVFFRNGSRKWRRRGRKVETDSAAIREEGEVAVVVWE
jgi:hypothetical protein